MLLANQQDSARGTPAKEGKEGREEARLCAGIRSTEPPAHCKLTSWYHHHHYLTTTFTTTTFPRTFYSLHYSFCLRHSSVTIAMDFSMNTHMRLPVDASTPAPTPNTSPQANNQYFYLPYLPVAQQQQAEQACPASSQPIVRITVLHHCPSRASAPSAPSNENQPVHYLPWVYPQAAVANLKPPPLGTFTPLPRHCLAKSFVSAANIVLLDFTSSDELPRPTQPTVLYHSACPGLWSLPRRRCSAQGKMLNLKPQHIRRLTFFSGCTSKC